MDKIKIAFNKPKISKNIIKLRNTINSIYESIDFDDISINYNKICINNEQNISIYKIFKYAYDNNLLSSSLNSYSLDKQSEFKSLIYNNDNNLTPWMNTNGKSIMREVNTLARLKKIPSNLYNSKIDIDLINEFVEMDILEYLLNKLEYKHQYSIKYNTININLVIYSKNKNINSKTLNNIIDRIIVIALYKIKKGYVKPLNINIDIFMTHFKKKINTHSKILGSREINSGFATPFYKLCIFRKEELNKVLIHELIHYLELDLNSHDQMFPDFYNYFNMNPKTEIRINEAYTETLAVTINSILTTSTFTQFKKMIYNELKFSFYQVAKILDFYKFDNANDFFCPHNNDKFQQNTSIFSYFIVKTAILYNLELFYTHYHTNSITVSNFKDFIISIIHSDFVNIINKYMEHVTKHKQPITLYNCLKMTYNDN
tara:strand:- start:944 stop:2233 length:1290 start_codon:yes stop_codon:yes gene_type:complete